MGDQGGLRTGWLAAFGTEGYDGEPPLLEELGVNFDHIQTKVSLEVIKKKGIAANSRPDIDSSESIRADRPTSNG
jgi:hypothetical protein